jgi:indolepyruvate ferredoxin oxidoreductase
MLPEPKIPALIEPLGMIVTGIGGTGVITLGAIIGMAAHLDGISVSTLDLTGLAQKYGAVMSHIRFAPDRERLHAHRLAKGEADVVIGCDLIVAAGAEAIDKMSPARTRAILSAEISPTRDFAHDPDWRVDHRALVKRVAGAASQAEAIAAADLARSLVGDPLGANLILLGYAWQKGWLPLSRDAIERAIRLNGAGVDFNLASFAWGRTAAHDLPRAIAAAHPDAEVVTAPRFQSLVDLVDSRCRELTDYQDSEYADRYRRFVTRVVERERELRLKPGLAEAVARYYYKLLAYKDEFEVARLYSAPVFRRELEKNFQGDYSLRFHLGAGPFARRDSADAEPRKTEVGGWILPVFHVLARLRFLRGTMFDPFARSSERRLALREIAQYEADIETLLADLDEKRHSLAIEIASLPEKLRGYGHIRERSAVAVAEKRAALWQRWQHHVEREPVLEAIC